MVERAIALRYKTYVCPQCAYQEQVTEMDADPTTGIWVHLDRNCPMCGTQMEDKTMVSKIVEWLRGM